MRIEFRQGVPEGCARWLHENVGPGNIYEDSDGIVHRQGMIDIPEYAWFYERITTPIHPQAFGDDQCEYVPTIIVKDSEMAVMFALRWS